MGALLNDILSDWVFLACAPLALAGGLTVVLRRNPVYSALGLLAAFLSFAVVFIKLSAPFLAAMHVLVYTGAIVVLFLFVIMLLNLSPDELGREHGRLARGGVGLLAAALLGFLVVAILRAPGVNDPPKDLPPVTAVQGAEAPAWGGVEHVGDRLFRQWVLPFELISLLIIVAILGAVVLARKRLPPEA